MTKTARKRMLSGLLALLIVLAFLPGMTLASPMTDEAATSEYCCYDCVRGGYSIEEIREILNAGGQIYQDVRIHYEDVGVVTYTVPVPESELEHLLDMHYGNIQPLNSNPFTVTQIRDSERSHADSIVVILLSDGFAYGQIGTWPNPARETALWHADQAITRMLSTRPFNLFADLFTVYMIHSYGSYDPRFGGYLHTLLADERSFVFANPNDFGVPNVDRLVRRYRIDQLADGLIPRQYQDMIQVISNSTGYAGMGWVNDSPTFYNHHRHIAVASINRFPWEDTTYRSGWHTIFLHEFGHSFGALADENTTIREGERRANATAASNENIKWQHWFGHRLVFDPPPRFNGWAVPAGTSICIMGGFGNYFCGVCSAELTRRLAYISREPFHGRSPATDPPSISPNYPRVYTPIVRLYRYGNVTRILDSAFHGNRSIETVHIPASIVEIGDFAFIGTINLTTIHNQRTIPQQINYTTFAGVTRANVTVYIPLGKADAYRAAGWYGFNLVETVPDYLYAKFEFYTSTSAENDYIRVPIEVGQPLDMTSVESALDELNKEARFAFWGWFTEEALNVSGRHSTASNVAPNLRRPVVGTEGFDVGQVITQEVLDRYAQGGVIHLRSVWSLWGDVNDDGLVNPIDANLLFQHVGHTYGAPVINLAPADVFRDGTVDPTDANVLFQHVGHVFGAPPLGSGPQQTMRSGIETAQWQISYDASSSSETLTVGVSLYESTQRGMGLTLLTVQYDSALLSNPRVVSSLRLDRTRFEDTHYMFYDLLTARGYTEADMVLHPIFSTVVVDDSSYHNNFIFDYLVHPQHILSPDMIVLRWNSSSLRMPYMGSDIFVNITFDVAPGAQIADRGAVWFTDEHQFMGWAVGTGSNQLILID